jgi:hypothetical protein
MRFSFEAFQGRRAHGHAHPCSAPTPTNAQQTLYKSLDMCAKLPHNYAGVVGDETAAINRICSGPSHNPDPMYGDVSVNGGAMTGVYETNELTTARLPRKGMQ